MPNIGDIKGGRPQHAPAHGASDSPGRGGKLSGGSEGAPQQPLPHAEDSAFGGKTSTASSVPTPMRTVAQLLPDLKVLTQATDVPPRFAADLKLLFSQLNAPSLTSSERAQRVFEFFTKYAEVFVKLVSEANKPPAQQKDGKPPPAPVPQPPAQQKDAKPQPQPAPQPPPQQADVKTTQRALQSQQLFPGLTVQEQAKVPVKVPQVPVTREQLQQSLASFSRTLGENGFETFKAGAKFADGKAAALALLQSASVPELQQKAKDVQISAAVYPPGAPSEAEKRAATERPPRPGAEAAQVPKELIAGARGDLRVNPHAAEHARANMQVRSPDVEASASAASRRSNKVLGSNMLWNVLHRMRGEDPNEALLQDNWDKITFGALMFLVFVALVVVALVSL